MKRLLLTDLAGTGSAPGAPYLDFGARFYSPRYERVRLNYMDDYGYKTSSGDQVLAAARASEPRSYRQWLSGSAGSNAITTVTGAVGELASGVGQQFYNERQGTWTGRNLKRYQMDRFYGNGYTGGQYLFDTRVVPDIVDKYKL